MTRRYIWIGRKIRHSPGPVGGLPGLDPSVVDRACRCGFTICSLAGPCAPKGPSPEPAEDVLPEGWHVYASRFDAEYEHVSGARVRRPTPGYGAWMWWEPGEEECHNPKPTRAEAMAAALAVKP